MNQRYLDTYDHEIVHNLFIEYKTANVHPLWPNIMYVYNTQYLGPFDCFFTIRQLCSRYHNHNKIISENAKLNFSNPILEKVKIEQCVCPKIKIVKSSRTNDILDNQLAREVPVSNSFEEDLDDVPKPMTESTVFMYLYNQFGKK